MFDYIFKPKKVKKSESKVFFVRGFQRSGTNWVCNLLNLHPEISCVGEFHFKQLYNAQLELLNRPYIEKANKTSFIKKEFVNFVEKVVKEHAGHNLWCGDRTPCALEDVLIENRKYILIHRDGRDCLISWIYHLFRLDTKYGAEMEAKKEKFVKNPEYFEHNKNALLNRYWTKKIARNWNYRVLKDLKTIEDIENKKIEVEYKFIKYKDLIASTETIRKELYEFLGVDYNDAKALNNKTTPGFEIHLPYEHNRIGKAGRWKEYFTEEQIEWFEEIAHEALLKLGYPIYTKQNYKVL